MTVSLWLHIYLAIQLHFVKSGQIRSFFSGPYFPVFVLNKEIYRVSLCVQSRYEKTRTRKKSVFGNFSCSVAFNPFFDTCQHVLQIGSIFFLKTLRCNRTKKNTSSSNSLPNNRDHHLASNVHRIYFASNVHRI